MTHFALASAMAMAMLLAAGRPSAADYQVATRSSLVYAKHGGTALLGDLYLPKGRTKAPVMVAFHGGAWRAGSRGFYRYWGRFLARNGYALFTVDYRLGLAGRYPAAVYDGKAAIQFVRAKAAEFDIDPDRIGLMGDSAGGQLAALLALAADRFTADYRDDANAATPASVRAVVGFYGIYDMLAQATHDARGEERREALAQANRDFIVRPHDSITEEFLGVSPERNRSVYVEASPISYATGESGAKDVRFLLIHGSRDTLVDPASQTGAFQAALAAAGFSAQQIIVPGAAHFWASDPFENERSSYGAKVAPEILRFLDGAL